VSRRGPKKGFKWNHVSPLKGRVGCTKGMKLRPKSAESIKAGADKQRGQKRRKWTSEERIVHSALIRERWKDLLFHDKISQLTSDRLRSKFDRGILGLFISTKSSRPRVPFKSILEYLVMKMFEDSPSVLRWEYEHITFKFTDSSGKIRRHTPDILVEDVSGNLSLFEVKGTGFLSAYMSSDKYNKVSEFCKTINLPFYVIPGYALRRRVYTDASFKA